MFAHIVRVIYKSCSWFKTTGSIFSILLTARTRQIPYKGYCNLPLKCIIDQCIIIAFRFKENVIIKKREWINTCFSVPVDFLCVSLKTKIIKPVKWNSYPLKFSILALLKKNWNLKLQTKMNISAVLKLSWFFLKYNALKSCTYFGLWKRD